MNPKQRLPQTISTHNEEIIATQPKNDWRVICWSEGESGVLHASFTALRCWRAVGDGTCHSVALIGQRPADNPECEHRYYWSNFPPSTPPEVMVEYPHRPRRVEKRHEEAKFEILPTASPVDLYQLLPQ